MVSLVLIFMFGTEYKTHTWFGMDQFNEKATVYFLTQIIDIDINKISTRIEMGIPYLVGYLDT